ncbi:hypothetical protein, partial [Hydrogenophaga sp.]|uniref:hypothetical protein n=1 Tax=Hydrogenophaga sp. TaxID=1904254 RepID=UPI003569254A
AGSTGTILYPAPNAAGLLVAILTHSLLVNGTRESERKARQTASDQALLPYQGAIDRLNFDQLALDVQSRLISANTQPATPPRVVYLQPHFRVATDHRVIVLDTGVRVQDAEAARQVRFDGVVQVVSPPREGDEPLTKWLDNDAQLFRDALATMLSHAVDIALRIGKTTTTEPARTQRYVFGNEVRMERGQPLATGCGRVVLWTLRESWMSVPISPSEPATCIDRYQVAQP